jgi:outer membrane protein assembly factor BamA
VLPLATYSPETKLAFGGIAIYLFRLSRKDTLTRTSNIRTALVYTTRNQLVINSDQNIFFDGEKYQLRSNFTYLKFPDNFYGVGNQTRLEDEEIFESNIFNIAARVMRGLGNGFFVGLQYKNYRMFRIEHAQQSQLGADSKIVGAAGAKLSGLGLLATLDKRNNVLYPEKGSFLELSARTFQKGIGSQFAYWELEADLRKYFPLSDKQVVAVQVFRKALIGNVPFQEMALLGGDKYLRGHYRGRYRDHHAVVLQSEYRHRLSGLFGFTCFAGIGQVARTEAGLWQEAWQYSIGTGLRVALNRKEKLNLRIDYGYGGKGNSNFYLNLAEAF